MPGGDRTGPAGEGPRTGRGLGDCAGGSTSWWPSRGMGMAWGRGFGRSRWGGRGMGWGPRWGGYAHPWGWRGAPGPAWTEEEAAAEELDVLQAEANELEQGLQSIRARIAELRSRGGPDQG